MQSLINKKAGIDTKILILLLAAIGVILLSPSFVFASYTIDSLLSDWGVNPFYDWTPWDSRVDYVEEDWSVVNYDGYIGHGSQPDGYEPYDVEAFYFDDDEYFIYFAMVSSFPFRGRGDTVSGDISIGLGSSGDYKYGIKVKGLSQYGSLEVPLKKLRNGDSWTYCSTHEAGPIYLDDGVGEDIGRAEVYYNNMTNDGGPYNEPATRIHTWVVEGKVGRFLFDGHVEIGEPIRLHYSIDCGSDYIDLTGDFDSKLAPEPASMFLVGLGVFGHSFLRRRKNRR